MPLDKAAIGKGCRHGDIETANHLCRAEIERFREALTGGDPITVGCTQEAALFSEIADEIASEIPDGSEISDVTFANIRETAGWSKDAKAAGPKMAALLAAAAEPLPEYTALCVKVKATLTYPLAKHRVKSNPTHACKLLMWQRCRCPSAALSN